MGFSPGWTDLFLLGGMIIGLKIMAVAPNGKTTSCRSVETDLTWSWHKKFFRRHGFPSWASAAGISSSALPRAAH
jgi:hypothetical protein